MNEAESAFDEAGRSIENAMPSQMFGKRSYKAGSKAFACFFQDAMVFKLSGDQHATALALEGAKHFDPSGKGRPMKAWVQVPYLHHSRWHAFAAAAHEYATKG